MNLQGHKKVQEVVEHLCNLLLEEKNVSRKIQLADAIAKLKGF